MTVIGARARLRPYLRAYKPIPYALAKRIAKERDALERELRRLRTLLGQGTVAR